MSDTIASVAANDPLIDGLLQGVEWNTTLLTYGFPGSAAQYGGAAYGYDHDSNPATPNVNEASTASALSAEMRTGIARAMTDLAGFTAIQVARLLAGDAGFAQLRFGETTTPRPVYAANTAYANWPNDVRPGDAWFDDGAFNTATLGSYQYAVGIHELGHLLGLKHGHIGGGPGATDLPAAWDSTEFSIMTYASYVGDTTGDDWNHAAFAHPQGWMMLDIRALQHMYGVDYSYRAGDTTYAFDPTTGELRIDGVSQGVPGSNTLFRTIWDGFGTDTYDFSAYDATMQMRIDLRAGDASDPNIGWTDVDADSTFQAAFLGGGPNGGFARGQVANAMLVNGDTRSLIENAIAGAGDDSVTGNQANNLLQGRDGDDQLSGLAGEDTLRGGNGGDHLDGGAGFDMASYADAGPTLLVDLAFDRGDGTFGKATFGGVDSGDTFLSIEDIEGSPWDDRLFGVAGQSNRILGGGGQDSIDGRGGEDFIDGGLGNDTVVAHGGEAGLSDGGLTLDPFDVLVIEAAASSLNWATGSFSIGGQGVLVQGFEIVQGGGGGDRLTAGAASQSFYGNAGNDTLTGGAGDNVLEGGEGADLLTFGGGFDYADYRSDTAGVLVDIRSFIVTGGHATGDGWNDAPEGILAGAGNDSLGGSDGDNRILGRAGNDYLSGYAGLDSLDGGEGSDSIEGGLGADTVLGGDGDDAIVDTLGLLLPAIPDDNAADSLGGGAGNDSIAAGGGADSLDGGTEDDVLAGGERADSLLGGTGNDILSDHTQQADAGGALLAGAYAATDADTLLGGLGVDMILASGGGDSIDGGGDIDSLVMDVGGQAAALAFAVGIGAAAWTMTLGGVLTATVKAVETLIVTGGGGADVMNATRAGSYVVLDGGAGNDQLRGGASADILLGGAGNDKLYGNAGDDLLQGGAGRDILQGGTGADGFRWDLASEGRDMITGFVSGEDRLWIDASGFRGGLREGMDLDAAGRFVLGTAATAARGQFLYDQASGALTWDVDGTGTRAAVLIATLDPGSLLAAGDFTLVA